MKRHLMCHLECSMPGSGHVKGVSAPSLTSSSAFSLPKMRLWLFTQVSITFDPTNNPPTDRLSEIIVMLPLLRDWTIGHVMRNPSALKTVLCCGASAKSSGTIRIVECASETHPPHVALTPILLGRGPQCQMWRWRSFRSPVAGPAWFRRYSFPHRSALLTACS